MSHEAELIQSGSLQHSRNREFFDVFKSKLDSFYYNKVSVPLRRVLEQAHVTKAARSMPRRFFDESDNAVYLHRLKSSLARSSYSYLPGSDACYPNRFLSWSARYLPDIKEQVILAEHLYFALHATGDLKRMNGQPYMTHPIAVAMIKTMADIKEGKPITGESIGKPLLHDLVEDQDDISHDDIERYWGKETRRIVESLSESSFEQDKDNDEFERFQRGGERLIRGGSEAIAIRIADRVHNFRTMRHIPDIHKRRAKARDTYLVVAQLAEIMDSPYKYELFKRVGQYMSVRDSAHFFGAHGEWSAKKLAMKNKWRQLLQGNPAFS